MNRPLITIATGTYNRLRLLKRLMQSVADFLPPGITYNFSVCDGGSTDGTLEYLRSRSDVILVEHGELRGAIKAFTDACYAANGHFVLIANDDVYFVDDTILHALVHLQKHPYCGAVAIKDNRPIPMVVEEFHALQMPALVRGRQDYVYYAQVGLFRKWLGDLVGWWMGRNGEMSKAWTYGGDNFLSAQIWALGYTVDRVESCKVVDDVYEDELREVARAHPNDGDVYYGQFNRRDGIKGPVVPYKPQIEPQDERSALRILYLPIFEPGWEHIQKVGKTGLRDALARRFTVYEFDYMAYRDTPVRLREKLTYIIRTFQPHLMITQLQDAVALPATMLRDLRALDPNMVVFNWNGDYWPDGLVSPEMIQLLKHVDLQLVINGSVIPTYEQYGIRAAYWQIGYEEPGEDLPEMPRHDVVFLANAYSQERVQLEQALSTLEGVDVGLYGSGWKNSRGQTTYDFRTGKAIYRNARLSIGDNQYPQAYGFVSNRLFQALASGGALLLHQHVPGLQELTGLVSGEHYIEWRDLEHLLSLIHFWLDEDNHDERLGIAAKGMGFVEKFHSFDARVDELFNPANGLMRLARAHVGDVVSLEYVGRNDNEFGVNVGNVDYYYLPGRPLVVAKEHVPALLTSGVWRVAESVVWK